MQEKSISFRTAGLILAGLGEAEKIGAEAKRLKATRALIVTDKGIREAGILDKIRKVLEKEGLSIGIFDRVEPDPAIKVAEECLETAKSNTYDLIIGLGGGSPIDIAKVTSVMLTNEGTIYDYFGVGKIPNPGVVTIMLPTTSGTGAEVTPNAILTDTKEKLKKGIVSPYLFPQVAIVDSLLTVSMPPKVTAATGVDALTHAIESYVSVNATSLSDMFAEKAVELIARSLRAAFAKGENLKARQEMSLGSLYAGIANANAGVGAVHALAYPLGGQFNVSHGVANALMLSYVMEFNALGCSVKFARIATLMGEETKSLSILEASDKAVQAVRKLCEDVKIPLNLKKIGVPENAIPGMAKSAIGVTRLLKNNPRNVTIDDIEMMYKAAF